VRLGRLGIDLKIKIDVWEYDILKTFVIRGKFVEKLYKQYYSQNQATRLRDMKLLKAKELIRTKIKVWVSDHFGIAVGIKIRRVNGCLTQSFDSN
jgi:hypothetical protein